VSAKSAGACECVRTPGSTAGGLAEYMWLSMGVVPVEVSACDLGSFQVITLGGTCARMAGSLRLIGIWVPVVVVMVMVMGA
jgi:hypothetical protein